MTLLSLPGLDMISDGFPETYVQRFGCFRLQDTVMFVMDTQAEQGLFSVHFDAVAACMIMFCVL